MSAPSHRACGGNIFAPFPNCRSKDDPMNSSGSRLKTKQRLSISCIIKLWGEEELAPFTEDVLSVAIKCSNPDAQPGSHSPVCSQLEERGQRRALFPKNPLLATVRHRAPSLPSSGLQLLMQTQKRS